MNYNIQKALAVLCCVLLACACRSALCEGLIFKDDFKDSSNWTWGTKAASVQVKDGELISGTSATGVTLNKDVPKDFVLETKVKVSMLDGHKPSEPSVRGARICFRKTEKDGIWDSYIVHLWFPVDEGASGTILIRKYAFNMAENKYIPEVRLFEKRWPLKMDTWYNLRVGIKDSQITIWIDGEEAGTVMDKKNMCPEGRIAISGYGWPSYAHYKDFKVMNWE